MRSFLAIMLLGGCAADASASKSTTPHASASPQMTNTQSSHEPHAQHASGHVHAPGHAHAGPIGHRFEDAKAWSKVFDDPARDAWQKPRHVVELLALSPGMTVVDLGAGTGYFEPYLSRAVGENGKVWALDPEPTMVAHLEARGARGGWTNVLAQRVPFDDPQLAPESVDRVLVVDTWHHIGERSAYASKLAAALRSGGFVLIVDFTLETDKGPPREHRLAAEAVVAELAAGGLKARVVSTEALPDQYVVVGTKL